MISRIPLFLLVTLPLSFCAEAREKTWVILNNAYKGAIQLDFTGDEPCLRRPLMEEWGVFPPLLKKLEWDDNGCLTARSAKTFELKYWYRPDAQLLTLLFPEPAINAQQNGISTSRWDNGINALFVNYQLDVDKYRTQSDWDPSGTEGALNLDSGINFGPWRLRQKNNFWRDREGLRGSYSNGTSLWRNIASMRSRLTLGDGYTSANMFESFTYRGAALGSDEAMFPDSWRPYAPWINGYARTEAEVFIYQNGERVYRIHVPPGPFTIRDFYPPNPDGDLELTIQENDGTERKRKLPYSVMPNLVQHRMFSYELIAGHYKPYRMGKEKSLQEHSRFFQSTGSWGIAPKTTLFAGVQQAEDYASQVVGVGGNLGRYGALSFDVSQAQYTIEDSHLRGSMWKLRYAKAFFQTETSINAQLRWYPSNGRYRSFSERISRAENLKSWWWLDSRDEDSQDKRAWASRLEVNQNFGEDSSLALVWEWGKARRGGGIDNSLTMSVSANWWDMDVSLYSDYRRSNVSKAETTVGVNISIPFSLGSYTTNVGYVSEMNSQGPDSHGINIYGTALSDYSLNYDVTAQHVIHEDDRLNASLRYQYNAGEMSVSMDRGSAQRHYHAGVNGSVLVHSGGVALGQTLGSTAALVQVPGTPDIGFYNQFGSTTNGNGDLLVSYLTPWRVNRVTMDSYSLPEGMRADNDEVEAVPTEGAIVRLKFMPLVPDKDAESDRKDTTEPSAEKSAAATQSEDIRPGEIKEMVLIPASK
ncbi:fimbria/pilus outer membrane usher protein [Erwinia sp. HR93]|uniref:fimbria/pilus outer membrane usher protein n=1 Tax=Erwinia sp. HR93 TaxID=3094840 RepID=UPI002ADEB772|nr:fimbria/pilus outer membrane usher protein [Erwinia sp. HR93]MEA1064377.1 fimbria/pilus outer membrane usher protein [Erwinia sp. HR93]